MAPPLPVGIMDSSITWPLALLTFVIVIVIAFWMRMRAKTAKSEHAHSAMTAARPDQRRTDGAPGVDPQ